MAETDQPGTGQGQDAAGELRERTIAFVRAFGLHRPEATPCGRPLPVSDAHALMDLERDGPLSQKALAARLNLDKSTVSRLVAGLEGKGWVERQRDPRDGRVTLLALTPAGRATAYRIDEARTSRFAGMLRRIPEAERASVLRALAVLADAARGGEDAAAGDETAGRRP